MKDLEISQSIWGNSHKYKCQLAEHLPFWVIMVLVHLKIAVLCGMLNKCRILFFHEIRLNKVHAMVIKFANKVLPF